MDFVTGITVADVAVLVSLVICAWLGIRLAAANRCMLACDNTLQTAQTEIAILRADVETLTNCIKQLERQMQHLSGRQNQLELRDPITQTYEPAIRLVRKGADVEELVSTCGLARGEAELIMMLHRNATAAGAACCA